MTAIGFQYGRQRRGADPDLFGAGGLREQGYGRKDDHAGGEAAQNICANRQQVLEERDSCFRASSGKVVLAWPVHLVGLFRQPCSKTHSHAVSELARIGGYPMGKVARWALGTIAAAALMLSPAAFAADALKEIHIDWATYNPVSLVLKQKGLLEKEFAKDGISIVWVQSAGSNKALEFLNAGSIDFGSTAGSAALVAKINGNPIKSIYVYSRPEWTALVTTKDSKINSVADLRGKRVAVTRGTDPHIFLVRALLGAGLSEKDITPVLLQHADGKTALIRGDVDAWAGLDPMMAQAEIEDGAKLFYRNADANTWGILNVREQFLKDYPDIVRRVLATYEEARKYSLANYDDLKKTFMAVTRLPENVVDKQLKERTELTHNRIGAPQRESILAAGVALQQAGVIDAKVDVKAALDSLIDDQVPLPTN
jgi:sulfonate transport system substrate-binding protein